MSRSRLVLVLIATIAASMVIGGVAVAVATPKKVSACTAKKGAVRVLGTTVKCKKGEKKLTWRVTGRAGKDGARGARGATGATGAKGAQGPRGLTGKFDKVRTATVSARLLSPVTGGVIPAKAVCNAGEQVIGGGFAFTDTDHGQHDAVRQSRPFVDASGIQGWVVDIVVVDAVIGDYHGVTAYALCTA